MTESDKRHCKICNELKSRILDGKYNAKDKRYKDENGKLWNGKICPSCQKRKTRDNMRSLRDKQRSQEVQSHEQDEIVRED